MDRGKQPAERSFKVQGFSAAFAFMTRVAMIAEKVDHHPLDKCVQHSEY